MKNKETLFNLTIPMALSGSFKREVNKSCGFALDSILIYQDGVNCSLFEENDPYRYILAESFMLIGMMGRKYAVLDLSDTSIDLWTLKELKEHFLLNEFYYTKKLKKEFDNDLKDLLNGS